MARRPPPPTPRGHLPGLAALVGLGLYLGRVAAEALPGVRQPWEAVGLTLAGLALAWLVARICTRWEITLHPLLLSWAYVLWPAIHPTLAWGVGLAMLVVWLFQLPRARLPRHAPEVALLLTGLALYGATVARTVLPADSGEFQLVAAVLGIAHPPGYPLYTMLGRLATLWPLGEPALGLNLLSVAFSAMTLATIVALVRHATPGRPRAWAWGGGLAALALAVSPTFWSQATTANIRSLTALLTALCLLLLVRWSRNPTVGRLAAVGLAVGLAIGHHGSLGLVALPMGAYVLAVQPRLLLSPRRWLPALGAFLGSFIVLLYLPLRSAMGPAFDPVPIDSFSRFTEHVLATGFRGDMFYFTAWAELLERGRIYLDILRLQFGPLLPWAMGLSLLWMLWRDRRLGLLLGGVWLVNAASALTYRAPQTVEYLLPSYVAMAACLGYGVAVALKRLSQASGGALVALLSVLVMWNGVAVWPDFRALASEPDARRYAETIFEGAPPDALVLANWHWATPMWYLQHVEARRPDLTIDYVYPQGPLSNEEVWLARLTAGLEGAHGPPRPVVVTNRFAAYHDLVYPFAPLGEAWVVRPEMLQVPPAEALPVEVELGKRVRMEAYHQSETSIGPGDTLQVSLYWRPVVPLERDYAVFVQLLGPQGVVGQADRSQPTSSYSVDVLRSDLYELPLLLQTPPGTYQLIAGFYTAADDGWERLTTAEGADHIVLGSVQVTAGSQRAATARPLAVRYTTGQRLRGMDVDHGVAGQTRLYLHWVGDAVTSPAVQLVALRDGVPVASTGLAGLERGQTATVVLDLPSDITEVQLGMEREGQTPARTVGPWGLPWRSRITLRLPTDETRYVPLSGGLAYVGVKSPEIARAGEPLVVRPRLMALGPVTRDYSVSVGVVSQDPPWERKSDGTPAMGAIPTLKWLSGWVVSGAYIPLLPENATPGPARVTVSAYDAFTQMPLAVLDERLAREGQGIFMIVAELEILGP